MPPGSYWKGPGQWPATDHTTGSGRWCCLFWLYLLMSISFHRLLIVILCFPFVQPGAYIFADGYNKAPGAVSGITVTVDLKGTPCLQFYYHKDGADTGSFRVTVGGTEVFKKSGDQGKEWNRFQVALSSRGKQAVSAAVYSIQFNFIVTHTHFRSSISLHERKTWKLRSQVYARFDCEAWSLWLGSPY